MVFFFKNVLYIISKLCYNTKVVLKRGDSVQAELQQTLFKLKEQRNSISKLIYGKRQLINTQYKSIIECNSKQRKLMIEDSINNLREEIEMLESDLENVEISLLKAEMSEWNLVCSNENIDLYKVSEGIDGTYFIYLHDTAEEAGVISYNPKYSNSIYGDISYSIYDDYQGHSYAFQALCMLSNYLEKNNIESIRISARKDNIPSIKTIQKYEKINDNRKIVDVGDESIIFDFSFKKKLHLKRLVLNNKI